MKKNQLLLILIGALLVYGLYYRKKNAFVPAPSVPQPSPQAPPVAATPPPAPTAPVDATVSTTHGTAEVGSQHEAAHVTQPPSSSPVPPPLLHPDPKVHLPDGMTQEKFKEMVMKNPSGLMPPEAMKAMAESQEHMRKAFDSEADARVALKDIEKCLDRTSSMPPAFAEGARSACRSQGEQIIRKYPALESEFKGHKAAP